MPLDKDAQIITVWYESPAGRTLVRMKKVAENPDRWEELDRTFYPNADYKPNPDYLADGRMVNPPPPQQPLPIPPDPAVSETDKHGIKVSPISGSNL